jgi:hypothetical protein
MMTRAVDAGTRARTYAGGGHTKRIAALGIEFNRSNALIIAHCYELLSLDVLNCLLAALTVASAAVDESRTAADAA